MPKLKPIGVKLDLSDLKKLKQIAQQEQRSIGFLIGQAVKLYLEAKEPELDRRDR
jgi:predicted transcriptional regulator